MRKEKDITIIAGNLESNRDYGKRFRIIELPAYDLEDFYMRALMALGTSGITVPQDMADAGAIGLALVGYQAFLGSSPSAVRPLKDEMMERCVHLVAEDNSAMMKWDRSLIEEVSTMRTLREEWLLLHTGFTLAALAQLLTEMMAAKRAARDSLLRNTLTSPE